MDEKVLQYKKELLKTRFCLDAISDSGYLLKEKFRPRLGDLLAVILQNRSQTLACTKWHVLDTFVTNAESGLCPRFAESDQWGMIDDSLQKHLWKVCKH